MSCCLLSSLLIVDDVCIIKSLFLAFWLCSHLRAYSVSSRNNNFCKCSTLNSMPFLCYFNPTARSVKKLPLLPSLTAKKFKLLSIPRIISNRCRWVWPISNLCFSGKQWLKRCLHEGFNWIYSSSGTWDGFGKESTGSGGRGRGRARVECTFAFTVFLLLRAFLGEFSLFSIAVLSSWGALSYCALLFFCFPNATVKLS